MKPKNSLQEGADGDQSHAEQQGVGEKVIDDKVLNALREKLVMDATAPYARFEDFDLNTLRGLTLDEAFQHYPQLLGIMDDVLVKVSTTISSVLKEKPAHKDDVEDCDSFALLLKKSGQWFYRHGHFDRALVALQEALKFLPEDGEIYSYIGDIHMNAQNLADAADFYKKARDIMPGDKKIDRMLAYIHIEMANSFLDEDLDTAYAFYKDALEYFPNYPGAICGLGGVALIRGNKEEAEDYFQLALEIDPDCVQALTQLGDLHMSENKDKKAEALYEEAIFKNQFFVPALTSMAKLQFHYRENCPRALQYVERILAIEHKNTEALLMKAHFAMEMENFGEAETALEHVLALDPTNKQAFDMYCRVKNGDCFFPPKFGSKSQFRAVKPDRLETSRDYYFSLLHSREPHNKALLDDYSVEVMRGQDEKFARLYPFESDSLN